MPWESFINQGRFTVPTASRFPSSVRTYLPRPIQGPDYFTVSTLRTYVDLDSQGYLGFERRSYFN